MSGQCDNDCLTATCRRCSSVICCCGPAEPPPPACSHPVLIPRSRRVVLTDCIAGLRLKVVGCDADAAGIEGWIRRRGQQRWLLKYPATYVDGDGLTVFRFDAKVAELPSGRYEMEVRRGCDVCTLVEIVVPPGCATLGALLSLPYTSYNYPARPEGVTAMFDLIASLTTSLCAPLAKTDTALPLSDADKAILCGLVLCRPVQLVLDDGVQQEIVEFSGCSAGNVVVRRGVGGTVPLAFPNGTGLNFAWTPQNVTNAVAGCP
jgi:hypothetical protein